MSGRILASKSNGEKAPVEQFPHSFPPQEDASAAGVPYCYYPSPDNGYSVADIRYSSSGVTANLTFHGPNLRAYEKSTTPIGTLRLEVKYHQDHMLQFKVARGVSGAGLFRWSRRCCFGDGVSRLRGAVRTTPCHPRRFLLVTSQL